jgi:hypothetical protein
MVRHPRRRVGRPHPLLSLGLLAVALVSLGLTTATPDPDPTLPSELTAAASEALLANKFIGAKKCKNCHKSDAVGNQFAKWEANKHAGAFETLASDAAKRIATDKGIEDPQKAAECLACHTTGAGAEEDLFDRSFKVEMGVQCESCHGPGQLHMKARMKAVMAAGDGDPAPVEPGEIISMPKADTCLKCHNDKSPTFKSFCFKEKSAKIRHLNPAKERTEEVLEALTNPHECTEDECKCSGS